MKTLCSTSAPPKAERTLAAGGFTLFECLAVVVLLSIALAVVAGSVMRGGTADQTNAVSSRILALDRAARLRCLSWGPLALELSDRGARLMRLRSPGDPPIEEFSLPSTVSASFRFLGQDGSVSRVIFGADGRSPDYTVTVRTIGGGESSSFATFTVHGLTGWVTEEQRP